MIRKALVAAILAGVASSSFAGDDWNGFYAGGSLGASSFSADFNDRDDYYDNQGLNGNSDLATNIGIHAGFNSQQGSFVYGAELGYTHFNTKSEGLPWDGANISSELESTISLKVRAGFASDTNLIYVAAGPTWGSSKLNATDAGALASKDSNNVMGLSMAAGIEHKFSKTMSARLQVEQTNFETSDLATSAGGDRFSSDDKLTNVTLGLSYHF